MRITIKPQQVIPTVLIVLQVASAIVYGCQKDPRRAIYWFAGAVLTAAVTF